MELKTLIRKSILLICQILAVQILVAQEPAKNEILQNIDNYFYNQRHRMDILEKKIDDVLWFKRVGDIAHVDKVFLAGAPPAGAETATTLACKNPVKFWSYVFIPRGIEQSKKYPLIVLPHGGVHGDFNTYYTHIIREMMGSAIYCGCS